MRQLTSLDMQFLALESDTQVGHVGGLAILDASTAPAGQLGVDPCRPAPSTLLLAIMSGFERRGRWNVPKRMTTFALFGGGVVDLRYADFTSPEVEIHSYSIMGGQTILVPPEVNVDLRGVGVMGTFDQSVDGEGSPGAPCVKVRGFSLWGRVGVKRKKRKAPSYGEGGVHDQTRLWGEVAGRNVGSGPPDRQRGSYWSQRWRSGSSQRRFSRPLTYTTRTWV